MPADYHTHTPLCRHASGAPDQYVEAAIQAGVSEFGISDHAPAHPEPFDDWRMTSDQLPEYFEWIESAKKASNHRVPIRAGLECDWLTGCEPWIRTLSDCYAWDYLIGSVHYLDDWDFDNPKWISRWQHADIPMAWDHYWNTYLDMVESDLFDIFAHPDLIKKFSYLPPELAYTYYAPVIDAIAASGRCIELNTAGWHKPCNDAYPSDLFLELACSAGIPIILSSDAHAPQEVARDFDRAIKKARAIGYKETQLFNQRHRTSESLLC